MDVDDKLEVEFVIPTRNTKIANICLNFAQNTITLPPLFEFGLQWLALSLVTTFGFGLALFWIVRMHVSQDNSFRGSTVGMPNFSRILLNDL